MASFMDERVISKLASNPELNLGRMIRDIDPAKPSTVRPGRPASSLGLLDTLPLEVILLTIHLLDFQSLSRLTRVCLRAKIIVENFAPFEQVMQHASIVLTALARTSQKMLRFNPKTATNYPHHA